MMWRQVRAKVLARRGEHSEAERLAREAVAIGDETDMIDSQGDAHADLAEVLTLGGNTGNAARELELALANYTRKGNVVSAGRTHARLAELSRLAGLTVDTSPLPDDRGEVAARQKPAP